MVRHARTLAATAIVSGAGLVGLAAAGLAATDRDLRALHAPQRVLETRYVHDVEHRCPRPHAAPERSL